MFCERARGSSPRVDQPPEANELDRVWHEVSAVQIEKVTAVTRAHARKLAKARVRATRFSAMFEHQPLEAADHAFNVVAAHGFLQGAAP